MNKTIFSFIILGACVAFAANWSGNPLAWSTTSDGFKTTTSANSLVDMEAPLSEDASTEAVIVIEKHTKDSSYAVAGVGLYHDINNLYHIALVQKPIPSGGGHFIELHQKWHDQWPSNDNLEMIHNEVVDADWKFNVPYRLKISKVKDVIEGTVHDMDGKLLFRRVFKFKDKTPVNFVRPVLRNEVCLASYSQIKTTHGTPVTDSAAVKNNIPPYSSRSFAQGKKGQATGFFRVEQDADGTWWAYDPLGRGFVVFGIDWVGYNGSYCEKLGRFLHKEYNDKRFPNKQAWEAETLDRLTSWGFNMLMGAEATLRHRGLAHAQTIGVGDPLAALGDEYDITPNLSAPCTAFPNVFHPKFKKWCEYRIQLACENDVDNPWVFGYFIDNELAWWGRGTNYGGLFDAALRKNAKHDAKIFIRNLLEQKANHDIAVFNKTWNQTIQSFDDILNLTSLPSATEEQKAIKTDFLKIVAEIYFKTVREAFKALDPNHMLLGCRFAGLDGCHDVVWETAAKYSDVITWNYYGSVDLDAEAAYDNLNAKRRPLAEVFGEVYEKIHRPVLITEWSFPALDSGLPCTYGAGQRFMTQDERSKATDIFARTMLSMPFLIGYDYFRWVDQPPLGISTPFPENTNYGIINLKGEPYMGLVNLFKKIQLDPAAARRQAISAPKPAPSSKHGLYDDFLATLPIKENGPLPVNMTVDFKSANDFTIDNGLIQVIAAPGNPQLVICMKGKKMGAFSAMTYYTAANGGPRWDSVTQLADAKISHDNRRLVIDLTGRYNQNVAGSPVAFEMNYRLVILPDTDWMLADFVSIKNLSPDNTLPLKGLFMCFHPFFDGVRDCTDEIPLRPVPNLWAPVRYGGFVSVDKKYYIGVAADFRDDITINYRKDARLKSIHPDSARYVEETVPAGGIYRPVTPFYLAAFVGEGTLPDMLKKALRTWR